VERPSLKATAPQSGWVRTSHSTACLCSWACFQAKCNLSSSCGA